LDQSRWPSYPAVLFEAAHTDLETLRYFAQAVLGKALKFTRFSRSEQAVASSGLDLGPRIGPSGSSTDPPRKSSSPILVARRIPYRPEAGYPTISSGRPRDLRMPERSSRMAHAV